MIKLVVIFLFVIRVKSEPHYDLASLRYSGNFNQKSNQKVTKLSAHFTSRPIGEPYMPESESRNDFYIEIRRVKNSKPQGLHICSANCSIIFDDDDTIELTCINNGNGLIKWNDQYEFDTGTVDNVIQMTISPDLGDLKLKLFCETVGNPNPRNISVSLVVNKRLKTPKVKTVYLNPGQEWTSKEKCYGVVVYPLIDPDKKGFFIQDILREYKKHQVIRNFDKNQNNTTFNCVKYNDISSTDTRKHQRKVFAYERVKTVFTFYLDPKYENNLQEKTFVIKDTESKADSQNNTAAILGGILGAVIIGLLGVILAIWYKSTVQPDDGAAEVIYTEIEEKPMAPNPPPRNPIPYTEVIGTLVPTEQPPAKPCSPLKTTPSQTENLYYIVK